MQTAVAHVHPRLEGLPFSLLELILGAAFFDTRSGPMGVGAAARGLLHVACTHRDLRAAAEAVAISKAAEACAAPADTGCDRANIRGELSAFASLPPFLRLFAIDHCQQLALAPLPSPHWYQDVGGFWRDIRDPNGGWYQDAWGVWHKLEEVVAAAEVMRTNREGVAQIPCCCCYTKVHGIPKELPATVAGFATAPVLFALLQRPGRYASYCVHANANPERGPRCFEHEDMRLRLQPDEGGGVEPKSVGTITLYSDVPVWYGQDAPAGGHQPTSLWIDVTQSKLGEKLLHDVEPRADDPRRSGPEQKWPELELRLLCPGVLITCVHNPEGEVKPQEELVFRTAPGDVYLKGGGSFSNWLLRFIPDEEESDEASLTGGYTGEEGLSDEESGEDEEDEEDAVVVEDEEES